MNPFNLTLLLIFVSASIGCFAYLFYILKRKKQLLALIGLFFFTMGFFLLLLDLVLIFFTHGPKNIPEYLLFNRLVSDTGFAGRWVLTVYVFIGIGLAISIYLLARNLIRKFNTEKQANDLEQRS